MKVTLKIKKVDCANCAAKIEDKIKKISDLSDVNYNFMSEKLTFHCDETILKTVYPQIQKIVHMIEPDAEIERHEHHHEKHCDCGHEHHHHEHTERPDLKQKHSFVIEGLDCANCAAKVERHLNHSDQLSDVQILFFNKTIKLNSSLSGEQLKYYLQSKVDEVEDGIQICDVNQPKEVHTEKKSADTDLIRIIVSVILLAT